MFLVLFDVRREEWERIFGIGCDNLEEAQLFSSKYGLGCDGVEFWFGLPMFLNLSMLFGSIWDGLVVWDGGGDTANMVAAVGLCICEYIPAGGTLYSIDSL